MATYSDDRLFELLEELAQLLRSGDTLGASELIQQMMRDLAGA